jgi:hypothetical protein
MRRKSFVRTLGLLVAGPSFLALHLPAQTPDAPSLGDAARQNREQKKSAAKPGTVITNDTLKPSATADSSPASAQTASPATTPAPDNTATQGESTASNAPAKMELSAEDLKKLKDEVAAIKEQLKDKQAEVDLSQRLLNLDRDAIFSKPDPAHDTEGKAKLDAEQEELTQKQDELAKLKAKLESIAPAASADPTIPKP